MVVCKCHKATKIYCFVHKVPVCGDCICQHPICVVRTYAEWVIDGEHEWPSKCDACQQVLQEDQPTCRLGCLHNLHSLCLEAHLKSFPPHTAPAGYRCPSCGSPVWPPQNFRDFNAGLPSKIKDVLSQVGLASILLGVAESERPPTPPPPPAFTTLPLADGSDSVSIVVSNGSSEITAAEEPHKSVVAPNSLARKGSHRPDKLEPLSYEPSDEDAVRRKYARRGPAYKQVLRYVLPFWSPQLPVLPITTPRRDEQRGFDEEHVEGGVHTRRRRSSAVDPRNLLLIFAIFSCIATIILLYYRLNQSAGASSSSS